MAKNILILIGSPRSNGNTATCAQWMATGAQNAGAQCKVVDVTSLEAKANGCTSCFECQEIDAFRCTIQDEVSELVASFGQYDVIVFATPVYFLGISAQLKAIVDRMFSHLKTTDSGCLHDLDNKTFALLATCGADLEYSGIKHVEESVKSIASLFLNGKFNSLLLPLLSSDPAKLDPSLEAKCTAYGEELAQ